MLQFRVQHFGILAKWAKKESLHLCLHTSNIVNNNTLVMSFRLYRNNSRPSSHTPVSYAFKTHRLQIDYSLKWGSHN